ncbi:MAG: glycosyltransferase [Akkermansiaceae bacterium]|nr:glycosyltransferase [Verrucomicrobiales bacterium]
MRISVVVPAFNEERLIGETLRQIQAAMASFTKRGWETEIIVCNNNSTDRTAEIAEAAGATVVFEPINQIARARNSGAQAATGDWLIFVDADSHPSAELFDDVAMQIESGRCLAGGCTITLQGDYPKARLIAGAWNYVSRLCRWVAGSFIFCEAKAFRDIGGFSHELFASEEIELSKRLKKLARTRGRKIVILHRHPLVTSARKLHLYTAREHLIFLARTVLAGGKTLNSREACHTWYDGRR